MEMGEEKAKQNVDLDLPRPLISIWILFFSFLLFSNGLGCDQVEEEDDLFYGTRWNGNEVAISGANLYPRSDKFVTSSSI